MSTDKARRGRPKGSGLNDQMHLDAIRGLISQDPSLKPTTAIKMLGITDPSAIRRLRDKFKSVGGGDEPDAHHNSAPHRESLDTVTALPQPIVAAQKVEDLPGSVTALLERAPAAKPAPEVPPSERTIKIVSNIVPKAFPPVAVAAPAPEAPGPKSAPAAAVPKPAAVAAAPLPEAPAQHSARASTGTRSTHEPRASHEPRAAKQTSSMSSFQSHGDEAMTLFVRWYALGVTALLSTAEAQVKVAESVLRVPPVALAVKQQLMFCEFAKALLAGGGKKPRR